MMFNFCLFLFLSFLGATRAQHVLAQLPTEASSIIARANFVVACHNNTVTFISKSFPYKSNNFVVDSCEFLEVGDGVGFVKTTQNELQNFVHPDGTLTNLLQFNNSIKAGILNLSNDFFIACVDGKVNMWSLDRKKDKISPFFEYDFHNSYCEHVGVIDTSLGLKLFLYANNKLIVSKAQERDDNQTIFEYQHTFEFYQTVASIKQTYKNIITICFDNYEVVPIDLSRLLIGSTIGIGPSPNFVLAKNDATILVKKNNNTLDIFLKRKKHIVWDFYKTITTPDEFTLYDAESISSVNYLTLTHKIMKINLV